ncbi:hypothetical protein [Bradyrhizobium sp. BR 1432]|uniref:hypothetical protein n=1 Tax=Bradyrhizobium sp. BR 1432 TaxID=3447966 RepID=UPI003EE7A39A
MLFPVMWGFNGLLASQAIAELGAGIIALFVMFHQFADDGSGTLLARAIELAGDLTTDIMGARALGHGMLGLEDGSGEDHLNMLLVDLADTGHCCAVQDVAVKGPELVCKPLERWRQVAIASALTEEAEIVVLQFRWKSHAPLAPTVREAVVRSVRAKATLALGAGSIWRAGSWTSSGVERQHQFTNSSGTCAAGIL